METKGTPNIYGNHPTKWWLSLSLPFGKPTQVTSLDLYKVILMETPVAKICLERSPHFSIFEVPFFVIQREANKTRPHLLC